MGHYILVDANSVGYTNHCSASLSYMGKPVQAIYGFINTLRNAPRVQVKQTFESKAGTGRYARSI